jgi:DNA-directed RNA polymerase specialized sigma subunit
MGIMSEDTGKHFKIFAKSLERAIEKYGDVPEKTIDELQKRQLESLAAKELEFRRALIRHPWGIDVYKEFIAFICDTKRNILSARPYFRERREVFSEQISKALKQRAERSLLKFHFNYQFVAFALKRREWAPKSRIRVLAKEIESIRLEMVEMNMPLAISRSRLFWSRTPKSQLTFMDFVQIACEGLTSAIDKFVLPYSGVFRSVIIGRIVGNFIHYYNETMLHFYPCDKRKIYRANKVLYKFSGCVDYEKLTEMVNDGSNGDKLTNPSEIADLVFAASCVSINSFNPKDPEFTETIDKISIPVQEQPEVKMEMENCFRAMGIAIQQLPIIQQKALRLIGVHNLSCYSST